jgi:serine/threonine protein kinase
VFAMEYAPYGESRHINVHKKAYSKTLLSPPGDLSAHVGCHGIPESCCKKISAQLSSALGFMHFKGLVHRDLKFENILVFALDFSKQVLITLRDSC